MMSQVLVAYNPSYSGDRDQEDHSLKPTQAKFSRPYLEKTQHKKRAGGIAQGARPEFKARYHKNK
jgi:hypothetical protein